MSRIDNRPLNQRIADAHWQPVKKSDDRSQLERAIDDKESQVNGKRLHGDKLALHLMKQEQRSRDDAFDEQERKREHLERRRSELARLQTLLERYEENEAIPEEMLVAVRKSMAQMADPLGCEKTANTMYRACNIAEQQRQDAIAQGIDAQISALDAQKQALQQLRVPDEIAETPAAKIKLTAGDLDSQAKELFSKICDSTEHTFEDTEAVYDAVRAHRAGNSAPIAAMVERYGEVEQQAESEAAE